MFFESKRGHTGTTTCLTHQCAAAAYVAHTLIYQYSVLPFFLLLLPLLLLLSSINQFLQCSLLLAAARVAPAPLPEAQQAKQEMATFIVKHLRMGTAGHVLVNPPRLKLRCGVWLRACAVLLS